MRVSRVGSCAKSKAAIDLARAFLCHGRASDEEPYGTGGTVPTSGPLKEAWRNRSAVVLEGDQVDIADLTERSRKATSNRYAVSGRQPLTHKALVLSHADKRLR
jgi:hypothetical protein